MTRVERLYEFARSRFESVEDPSHDFEHVLRVVRTAEKLGRAAGADLEILIPAALLHDIVQVPKNHPDRARASQWAAEEAGRILRELDYTEDEITRIGAAIAEHSYSRGLKPSSLESAVLQDADRLDAVGALGIMRNIACGTTMGSVFYQPEEPFADTRALDDRRYMIDHFSVKLFKLASMMNTPEGRAEAERRTAFMRSFLEQLRSEIGYGPHRPAGPVSHQK